MAAMCLPHHIIQEFVQDGPSFDQHSRNERLTLARLIDALLAKDRRAAMELAVRRLVGVHAASRSGSWGLAGALNTNLSFSSWLGIHLSSACSRISTLLLARRSPLSIDSDSLSEFEVHDSSPSSSERVNLKESHQSSSDSHDSATGSKAEYD